MIMGGLEQASPFHILSDTCIVTLAARRSNALLFGKGLEKSSVMTYKTNEDRLMRNKGGA
jgi:hypothetical protein